MTEYNKVNVKLPNLQLNKLKFGARSQTGVILRINIKIFDEEKLLHELLLTIRQRTN